MRRRLAGGELPGVAEEIDQQDLEELGIAADDEARGQAHVDLARRVRRAQVVEDVPGDLGQVDRLGRHHGARHARQLQKVVDELGHALGGGADAPQVVLRGLVEDVAVVLGERQAEAVEGAQRRAQVVRDGVAERFQLPVGLRQLLGARGDAPLEVGVHLRKRRLGGQTGAVRAQALGHVLDDEDEVDGLAVAIPHERRGDPGPYRLTALVDEALVESEGAFGAAQGACHALQHVAAVLGGGDRVERQRAQLLLVAADDAAHRRVRAADRPV